MKGRIVRTIIVTVCLTFSGLSVVWAQGSPLVGIPYMSEQPDGPGTESFPSGTDKVYVVFNYDVSDPVEIVVEIRSEALQGAVIHSDRTAYSGSGTAAIEVPGPDGPFEDGVYNTIIKFGPERYITAGWEWTVGDVQIPLPVGEQPPAGPESPKTGPAMQASQPVQVNSGLSPVVLAGLGVIVLFLLGVILWAVRGFMTAA